jgi:hypothetical protein
LVDASGEVSVFSGGREFEEGTVLRFTPWGQHYAAAIGVALGKIMPISKDRAVRLPFVAFHSIGTGLIAYGLSSAAAVSMPASIAIAALSGVQTDRLLHNRTVRYHALVDLFVVLGLLGCARVRTGQRGGRVLLAGSILLLPHTHTLSGSIISLLLAVQGAGLFLSEPMYAGKRAKNIFLYCFLPGAVALTLLLVLTRPWAQGAWGEFYHVSVGRSFNIHRRFVYAYLFMAIGGLLLFFKGNKWRGAALLVSFALLIMACLWVDRYQDSQMRYYLPVWLFCLLWPISMGLEAFTPRLRTGLAVVLFMLIVLPEFTTRKFHPYHGLELVIDDYRKERNGVRQPLHEIIDIISSSSKKDGALLFDSVPMYCNWYFPGNKVALMPDESGRHKLNESNPIWTKPLVMPDWHIWYPNKRSGLSAILKSDYEAHGLDMKTGRYQLTSKKLGQTVTMCVEKYWLTNYFNNNPLYLYNDLSLIPSGGYKDVLLLGKKCEDQQRVK